ncbi:MAG: ATP-binding protein [Anaerolineales bacterium]|nr:ATP-binding protein [Anaerolineales bacterium]QYK50138.1 MAG: ATP-binding protein [Anaerolineales bacterium]
MSSATPAIQANSKLAAEAGDAARRLAMFEVETPMRQLADLIADEHTLSQIRAMVTKIRHHRLLYEEFGLAEIDPHGGRTAINFYGPPGTGKSLAAEAIAGELGLGIIRVNYAEVESKYVGETPKNIKAAFAKASQTGALLFFDEADSILGKRLTNVSQSTDHAVNVSRSVMLLELDRFAGVVVFATNLASNYDPAFTRRILSHVAMPLPDETARLTLWQRHIPSRLPHQLTVDDWRQLAYESEGLAGGDILNAVLYAASLIVARDERAAMLTLEDLQTALAVGRRAKQAVGAKA